MSKKIFVAVLMIMSLPLCSLQVKAARLPVGLEVGFNDPENNGGKPQKAPMQIPGVSIEDYALTFATPCLGYTLELLGEDGTVAYTTVITSDSLVLPSTLSGDYELRLIPTGGSYYFYGYVLF